MSRCFNWFSFWWFRKTQVIPEFGGGYKEVGRLWEMCILFLIHHPLASISFQCSFFSLRFLPSSRNLSVISLNLLLECFFIRWNRDNPSSKEVRLLTYLCILSIRLWLFTSLNLSLFDISPCIYSIYSSGFNSCNTLFRELLWLHLKQR